MLAVTVWRQARQGRRLPIGARGSPHGPAKVLLGKRHAGLKFMAGKLVFPGGRMEPGDRKMPVASDLDPHAGTRLMRNVRRPSLDKARALALAAIRETFEETGLLLGTRVDLPVAHGTSHVQTLRPDGLQMCAPRDEHHVVVSPREQRAVVAAHGA